MTMFDDVLTSSDVYELNEILANGGYGENGSASLAALIKIWLSEPLNYDTVSVLYEGANPYDIDHETLYEDFWDSINEWAQTKLKKALINAGEYRGE